MGAALHVPPKGLGTALHDGSGRLMFVQGYGVALGVCGIGVTKDALQGCLHAVSIAVYAYSYTFSYPSASTSTQRLSVLYLFPREAGLFNSAISGKFSVILTHIYGICSTYIHIKPTNLENQPVSTGSLNAFHIWRY